MTRKEGVVDSMYNLLAQELGDISVTLAIIADKLDKEE